MNAGRWRAKPLEKTLSEDDIHKVLDNFGADNNIADDPLLAGSLNVHRDLDNGELFAQPADGVKFYVNKSPSASTLQEEWDTLFSCHGYIDKLKRNAFSGNLGTKVFRSVCWRLFWDCLPEEKDKWCNEALRFREDYNKIRNKYVVDPYDKSNEGDNTEIHHPLSQAEDSVWHKYFQDNELRTMIMQDLDRLFPEIEFFQKESVKKVMLHILFCYARENATLGYRQGMHEILAPILYVILENTATVAQSDEQLSADITCLLDMKYVEHDAYILFNCVMESIQTWYSNVVPVQAGVSPNPTSENQRIFQNKPSMSTMSAISKKLNAIQGTMLQRHDNALADHIKSIDITPQLYGIRWVRLLFGREFALPRLLTLWDAIFADAPSLALVDYICLSMLINLRGLLLQSDFATCLSYLMKYPENTDTKYILQRAVALQKRKTVRPQAISPLVNNQQVRPQTAPPPNPTSKSQFYVPHQTEESNDPASEAVSSAVEQLPQDTSNRVLVTNHNPYKEMPQQTQSRNTTQIRSNHAQQNSVDVHRYSENSVEKNPITSQISNLRTKVGSPSQLMNRIAESARTRTRSTGKRQQHNDSLATLQEDHSRLQQQVSELQSKLDRLQSLCLYCGGKMDSYLGAFQERLAKEEDFNDEISILCLAGLKQVRDILKYPSPDTMASTSEYDVDFTDIDRHIAQAAGFDKIASPIDTPQVTHHQVEEVNSHDDHEETLKCMEETAAERVSDENVEIQPDVPSLAVVDSHFTPVTSSKYEDLPHLDTSSEPNPTSTNSADRVGVKSTFYVESPLHAKEGQKTEQEMSEPDNIPYSFDKSFEESLEKIRSQQDDSSRQNDVTGPSKTDSQSSSTPLNDPLSSFLGEEEDFY